MLYSDTCASTIGLWPMVAYMPCATIIKYAEVECRVFFGGTVLRLARANGETGGDGRPVERLSLEQALKWSSVRLSDDARMYYIFADSEDGAGAFIRTACVFGVGDEASALVDRVRGRAACMPRMPMEKRSLRPQGAPGWTGGDMRAARSGEPCMSSTEPTSRFEQGARIASPPTDAHDAAEAPEVDCVDYTEDIGLRRAKRLFERLRARREQRAEDEWRAGSDGEHPCE